MTNVAIQPRYCPYKFCPAYLPTHYPIHMKSPSDCWRAVDSKPEGFTASNANSAAASFLCAEAPHPIALEPCEWRSQSVRNQDKINFLKFRTLNAKRSQMRTTTPGPETPRSEKKKCRLKKLQFSTNAVEQRKNHTNYFA